MGAKSILVLSFSPFHQDPRVRRQVECLWPEYRITVAAPGDSPYREVTFIRLDGIPRLTLAGKLTAAVKLALRRFGHYYWHQSVTRLAQRQLTGKHFDLIVANDIDTLPLALQLAQAAPVVFDAHEYAPKEFEDDTMWRLLIQPYRHFLCRRYLAKCASMSTVCEGIAREYKRIYDVSPLVVFNAPKYQVLSPSPTLPDRIRLIHHGIALQSRQIERMIDMFDHLDQRFTLDLMLVPDRNGYLEKLKKKAARYHRIRFRDPVAMSNICIETNGYDLGLFLLPPTNFNATQALPNKFFEFVQARLGIAIGPSPEMARLVDKHGLGIVADCFDPRALAIQLNALAATDINRFKLAADAAANQLCFEESANVLRSEVRRLIRA